MCPTQDLGPVVDDSDDYTSSLRPLVEYMEGNNFDLRGISVFLSSPSPIVQRAALQLLEHAAAWESNNFAECMSATFGPVAKLLDSQDSEVRFAALDTLKLFLASPRATDIVKPMMPRLVDALLDNLNSPDNLAQLASVELLDAATRSEDILVGFATVVACISDILPTMPTATQVTALRVLEVSAKSNAPELIKAVAETFQSFEQSLFSPETTVQIAALKVLAAGAGTNDPELAGAVKAILPVLEILSFDESDVWNAAGEVQTAAAYNKLLSDANATILPTVLPSSSDKTRIQGTFQKKLQASRSVGHPRSDVEASTSGTEMWTWNTQSSSLPTLLPSSSDKTRNRVPTFQTTLQASRSVGHPRSDVEASTSSTEVWTWSTQPRSRAQRRLIELIYNRTGKYANWNPSSEIRVRVINSLRFICYISTMDRLGHMEGSTERRAALSS
jgi:hypothetical protein